MGGGGLAPGDAGYSLGLRHIGPLVFSPAREAQGKLQTVAMKDREELCGRRLDWVGVVGGIAARQAVVASVRTVINNCRRSAGGVPGRTRLEVVHVGRS